MVKSFISSCFFALMLMLSPVSFAKDTVSNDSTVVNINTATVEDMQALKGVSLFN